MNGIAIVQGNTALAISPTEQIIKRYISSLDVKPRSKDTYRKGIKHFVEWLEAHDITSPSRADILEYKADMLKEYTACTVSSYLTAVKSFYTYLEGEKITPNIAAGIKGAKHQKGFRKDALTAKQAKEIISSIDTSTIEGKRNYALVNLLIRTGLRIVEAERANIEDIRSEAGEALLYIQGKGRDSKDAFVILTESTLKPIKEYLSARGKTQETAPLFASHSDRNNGGRLTTRSISRIAKEALRAAGYDDSRLTAHSMRHTAVTLSLLGGATIQEAQALARHQNINTTLIYAHNISRIANAPERKVDALLAY
jgi:integrase/recombinase XerC/integrase/recombinase XerD